VNSGATKRRKEGKRGEAKGVHGSVQFGLDLKNQPNRITVFL